MTERATQTFDCVIVGGGIVGLSCALALARDGHRTALLEAVATGHGATSAAMGHIVVMDDSPAQLALTQYSQRLWNDVAESLPAKCEFENCGTIWVAADADELTEARRKAELYRSAGVNCELVDERLLRELEPYLREGLAGGLLVRGDSVVYQPRAAAEFASVARGNGVMIFESTVIRADDDGVELADGTKMNAGAVVIAAGLATAKLIGLPEIITPKKGHLVITERYPGFASHQIIELGYLKSAHGTETSSVAFNVQPRQTGQVLIGSSRQFGTDDPQVEPAMIARMLRRAGEFMPAIAGLATIRAWAGFRPATPDNLPLIGRDPRRERVFIAAGHEGLGITTSTGTAAIIADLIAGRRPAIDAAPFDPARLMT